MSPRKSLDLDALAALLGELAAAVGSGHARPAVARRAATTLSRHLPLRSFELGWYEDGDADCYLVDVDAEAEALAVRRVTRPLRASRAEAARKTREILDTPLQRAVSIEERHAASAGAQRLILLPLIHDDVGLGYAALGLGPKAPQLEAALLRALGRILAMAQHNEQQLGRVAALSRRAHKENQQLRRQLSLEGSDDFVASSAAARQVLEQAELVAPHHTTVLLRGESGTGKELLARRIHQRSPRSRGALLALNCGALPENLVESELFGHEAGAFTGAVKQHSGRFERAHGGTLFLDEVAELPLSAQVKLLRVLQEGTFERVGGGQTLRSDVRVIAATHRPLEEMVRQGTFRADLFYRLSVFPIAIPPLRERPADIAPLIAALLPRIAARLGRKPPHVSTDALMRLTAYPWPGNVRELENVLERALILRPGELLDPPLLTPPVQPAVIGPDHKTLQNTVQHTIEEALSRSQGRVYGPGGAATQLGLKPSTLQSRMKKLGLDATRFRRAR